jgi:hypothetical protein
MEMEKLAFTLNNHRRKQLIQQVRSIAPYNPPTQNENINANPKFIRFH